ncbi:MAG TPA: YegS/Rv2252/BmrU family lipid kinase [Terracidiphilus sp.]|nr:YegS/Rv2252/BmrU family lipid kinase [Terracidiphilus sp.]
MIENLQVKKLSTVERLTMRRAALIYNPASGQHSARRAGAVREAMAVLREGGVEAEALETNAPGSASALARAAIRNGCDAILAAGGDGTVHEILQCLVGTNVALGVLPLGTANALAQNLGLGRTPVKAARLLLKAEPRAIPVGRILYRDSRGTDQSRFFTVAAGIGPDALLMSSMDAGLKRRLGYALYLLEAFKIWVTNPFPLFDAAFSVNGGGEKRAEKVSQLLAIRVRSFGGVLGELAPGATITNHSLSLMAFKTRSRLQYLRFLLAVVASRHTFSNDVELIDATSVDCRDLEGSGTKVFVEADGEVLGTLPARIEVARQTVHMLIPPHARP